MLQFKNATPFAGLVLPLPDADGVDTVFTLVKATLTLGNGLSLADEQAPVVLADQYHGDPATSSIRTPSDLCLAKPGTDVVLIGSAWAPGARPAWYADVTLAVGSIRQAVRVFGDRVWDAGPAGAAAVPLAPFERMPIVWERAYGGTDETEDGPVADPRNPVGCGFRAPRGTRPLHGLPLPNIEDPSTPISSPRDAPQPAGFAPVAPHWQSRRRFAGTYDEAWQKTRSPFLPTDFDQRFFQIAPPGLTTTGYLQGGEPVDVRGATPSGELRFVLPSIRVRVRYVVDGGVEERLAALDTVVVEPDAARLTIVWRAALSCDKKLLKIREVAAFADAA